MSDAFTSTLTSPEDTSGAIGELRPSEFIKGSKVEHSVLFLCTPDNSRCGKLRDRLTGQVSPAILVKSENDHIALSWMMKQ